MGDLTLEEFFWGFEKSRIIFEALCAAIGNLDPAEMHTTKSQIAEPAPGHFTHH